jgi:NTE family protein
MTMAIKDGRTLGLALSGGGFRATLFGLGSVWRLNDAGLLGKIDRVTSVSGGSILAGVLAHRWARLKFDNGRAANFVETIADPIRRFCAQTIDEGAILWGGLNPFKTAGEYLADRYDKDLFEGATIKNGLPVSGPGNPKFIIYATNLQTGRSFRFRQDMIADYMLGTSKTIDVPLAFAVAASSAFPPVFSPVTFHTDPASWSDGENLPNLRVLREKIFLADGGVYDNMGLESLVDNVDVVLVSDAGAPFEIIEAPWNDYLLQLGRVRDILIDQTRALRKRWLITDFEAKRKHGAYWGIGTKMSKYPAAPRMTDDTSISDALESVPTRLNAFDEQVQGRLINWGYALCDISLRLRAGLETPMATEWPDPAHRL